MEQALEGQPFNEETVFQAAERITQETQALTHNAYKVKLAPRVIARALDGSRRNRMSDVNDKSRRELLKATAAISAAGSLGLSMQSASAQ
ncbi:Uncharacterised protein [Pantoea agglomerans]|uniref:Twin-arginine translocation signal domain-containing protein n=1 Tax=Enterobacter agglomerans TaxID=549 RepID=A0A379LS26_ENTAG|nr:Uncharacterised protein [Pantoea agglomerans]